jgi:FtsH-binding integral membrane protein
MEKVLYYINVILSTFGIVASFYVLGWVEHENHTIIGSTCFLLFFGLLVGCVINYNTKQNKISKE